MQVEDANASLEPLMGRQPGELLPVEMPGPPEDLPQCTDAGVFQVRREVVICMRPTEWPRQHGGRVVTVVHSSSSPPPFL